ncbi:hypothetical protein [Rheinheimera sp. SA_1]|uniref:hypothetical protein n=1 Tax=Rheinheimera sp. SA_1 TaxID=1827365 RepID=UPI0012FBB5EE|nr:hypothetical protein [Rheinheimera sp. SA_1]
MNKLEFCLRISHAALVLLELRLELGFGFPLSPSRDQANIGACGSPNAMLVSSAAVVAVLNTVIDATRIGAV